MKASSVPDCQPRNTSRKPAEKHPLPMHPQGTENARQGLRYSDTRQRISKRYWYRASGSAKASEFIHRLVELAAATPGRRVFLYSRVSGDPQKQRGNLEAAKRNLRREVELLGCVVMGEDGEVGSGKSNELWKLERAAEICRRNGWVLVVEHTNRLIRSFDFHPQFNPSAEPTRAEWEAKMGVLVGVTVCSLLDPDMPWNLAHSYQTKRGMIQKEAKPGRPTKWKQGECVARRRAMQAWVVKLRRGWEFTLGEIVQETGIPKSTFRGWLKRK